MKNPLSRTSARRTSPAAGLALAGLCLFAAGARPAQDELAGVDGARALLEQWVEARKVISQERRDWTLGKEVLNDRIELVTDQIAAAQGRVQQAEASIAETQSKTDELIQEKERLGQASAGLAARVEEFERRTKELVAKLPPPIADRVQVLVQRFPEDPSRTEESLSARFMNFVGVLNMVNKFQREITVTSEVRTLEDGTSVEVTAVYLGIGQGYYASASGEVAGIGSVGEEGWTWRPANEAAAEITRVIQILQDSKAAEFVPVPVRVD